MSRFNVGDQVIMSRSGKIAEYLIDSDYEPEEYFSDRDLVIVTAVNDDGSVHKYAYARYYGVDEDGHEYEYDEPQPDYDDERTWNASDNPEWEWFTLQMLKDLKAEAFGDYKLDIICRKVLWLYKKHNNNLNTEFKWSNV